MYTESQPAQNYGIGLFELSVFIPESTGFLRAARRVVFGIKKQNHMTAQKFVERHFAAAACLRSKRRRLIAFL